VKRSEKLEAIIAAWFEAASQGDASLVDRHVSSEQGNRLIGSDPDEWLSGSAVAGFLRGEAERSGGNVSFVPSGTEAYEEGSVGWATTRLTLSLPDGKYVTPRWSAVFHKEGDTWRFVQTHASIAVPNDEVGWEYAG
jgi:ketosteroid isomerase-like protein